MRTAAACFMWFLAAFFMAMAPEVKFVPPVELWRIAGAGVALCVVADVTEIRWARLWKLPGKAMKPAPVMDITDHRTTAE